MSHGTKVLLKALAIAVLAAAVLAAVIGLSMISFQAFRWAYRDATAGQGFEALAWVAMGLLLLVPNAVLALCSLEQLERQ